MNMSAGSSNNLASHFLKKLLCAMRGIRISEMPTKVSKRRFATMASSQPRVRGIGKEPPLQMPARSILNVSNIAGSSRTENPDVPARNQAYSPSTLDSNHHIKNKSNRSGGSSSSLSSSASQNQSQSQSQHHSQTVTSSPVAVKSRGYYDFRGQYIEGDEIDFSDQQNLPPPTSRQVLSCDDDDDDDDTHSLSVF
jgi:hypothetical protein